MFFATYLCFAIGIWLTNAAPSLEPVFEWVQMDFDWDTSEHKSYALEVGEYIPENNVIFGAAAHGQRIFFTVPRWREGVPSTLNWLPLNADKSAPLRPYPDWDSNTVGDCTAMQNVLRIHADNYGRLWVVDAGTVNVRTNPARLCPPKLLIYDLITDELIKIYEFPEDVVSDGILSNIVVDIRGDPQDAYAYIAETRGNALLVYSLKTNKSWRIYDPSMDPDAEAAEFIVDGYKSTKMVGIVPIALSPLQNDNRWLYYSPLTSYKIYALPTDILRDEEASKDVTDSVVLIGERQAQSGATVFDDDGTLFYDMKGTSSVFSCDCTSDFSTDNQKEVASSDDSLRYVTTLFLHNGYLWAVSNDFHLNRENDYTFDKPHFHLVKISK